MRQRLTFQHIQKLSNLWPVVGIVVPRQSGKTTLLEHLLQIDNQAFLDEFKVQSEAEKSPQAFVDKLSRPALIDEIQKAPRLFGALKHSVDRRRIPGSIFITGSTSFSSRAGIRESLTGRIGLIELAPLTLCELLENQKPHNIDFSAQNLDFLSNNLLKFLR